MGVADEIVGDAHITEIIAPAQQNAVGRRIFDDVVTDYGVGLHGDADTAGVDAFPEEEFQGKIISKDVAVDQISKTLEVKIEILQPEVDVPIGVFARGDILVKTNQDTLIIPSSALARKKDGIYVYVIEEEIARQREVVLGIIQNEQVEILEGLSEKEEIVILGNQELEDGAKVTVLEKEK